MLEPLKFVAVFEAVMIAGAGGFSERNFVREGLRDDSPQYPGSRKPRRPVRLGPDRRPEGAAAPDLFVSLTSS